MTLTVYLDDSGTSPIQQVACATAVIVPKARIAALEREWRNLRRKEAFRDFHCSDLVARSPKSDFCNWNRQKQERVFNRVCEIAKKYIVQAFSFAVKKEDYESCVPGELRKFAGAYHYSWAIRHVARFAQTWRVDRAINEPYQWVFDWMEQGDPGRIEIEIVMKQFEDVARRQRGVAHEYENVEFRRRQSLAGLQCADLVAWTNYNLAVEKFFNFPKGDFAKIAYDSFSAMPVGSSPRIDGVVEWNFSVALKADRLRDWAEREISDGRSLEFFRKWEKKYQAKQT